MNSFSCKCLLKVIGRLTKPTNYYHHLIFHFDIAYAARTTGKFSSCTVADKLVNVCTKFGEKKLGSFIDTFSASAVLMFVLKLDSRLKDEHERK